MEDIRGNRWGNHNSGEKKQKRERTLLAREVGLSDTGGMGIEGERGERGTVK